MNAALFGVDTCTVDVILCSREAKCQTWPVLKAKEGGTLQPNEVQGNAAVAALAGANIGSRTGFPLFHTPRSMVLPSGVAERFGLDANIILETSGGRGDCHVVATASGYGHTAAYTFHGENLCARESLQNLWLTYDGLAIFTYNGCDYYGIGTFNFRAVAARLLNTGGMKIHGTKDYQASAAIFSKAVEQDPTYPQALFNLACARAMTGELDLALFSLSRAIALDPKTFIPKAKRDADLEALRDKPDYKKLVEAER